MSKTLTRLLSSFLYRLTRSKKLTIYTLSALFFPGTLIHELSHAIMARILFVGVMHMEFIPKIEGGGVKLGSVQVAKTDPVRRLLIGMAPFLVGAGILLGVLFFAATNNLFTNYIFPTLLIYVVFEVGNTMFSSKKDMEGALELLLSIIVLITLFYFLGFRIPSSRPEVFFANPIVSEVFQKGALFLLAPLGIDLLAIALLKLIQ